MPSNHTCPTCNRPVPDQGVICHGCTNRLRKQLTDLPWLADELDTTRIRDDNLTGDHVGGRAANTAANTAVPWNEAASGALRNLTAVVTSWCALAEDDAGARPADDSIQGKTHAIRDVLHDLRMHPAAADLTDEISDAHARALAVIDRPADRSRIEVGPCPQQWGDVACEGTVWAHSPLDGQPYIRCHSCGAEWAPPEWTFLATLIAARTTKTTTWRQAADIATLNGLTIGTVRNAAYINGWRRRKIGATVYYHPDDVTAWIDRKAS